MTAPALRQLAALRDRALANPDIATSPKRAERLRTVTALLERAAHDLPTASLRSLATLLDPKVIGHPDTPGSLLGRIAAGEYRQRPPHGRPLTPASIRHVMDGLVDLNRAAGHPPYWWQAHGMRPWSKHTRAPLDFTGHATLRRILSTPPRNARVRPYLLRALTALEILWDTGVTREGLVAADIPDLADDMSTIRLTYNLPGRSAATVETVPLSDNARGALRLWLPHRERTINKHLRAGAAHPANAALFVTLRHSVGIMSDGTRRTVPPGIRITGNGLEIDYAKWARYINREHHGEPGLPVPTDLYRVARGGRGTE